MADRPGVILSGSQGKHRRHAPHKSARREWGLKIMKRRSFLAAMGALPSAIAASSFAAADAFSASPPVFLDYTQEQMDIAYDQSFWSPDINGLQAGDGTASAAVRQKMPPRTVQYGPGAKDLIDIFTPANASGVPVMVFIRKQGAWLFNTRLDASYPRPYRGTGRGLSTPDFESLRSSPCRRWWRIAGAPWNGPSTMPPASGATPKLAALWGKVHSKARRHSPPSAAG